MNYLIYCNSSKSEGGFCKYLEFQYIMGIPADPVSFSSTCGGFLFFPWIEVIYDFLLIPWVQENINENGHFFGDFRFFCCRNVLS